MLNSSKSGVLPVALTLCAALLLLFWPVFFQGKVLVPGDIPNTDPFLSAAGGAKPPLPQNTLLADQIEQFYVYHSVAADGLKRQGHLPLWNPYLFTGQPLVANAQSSLFYPPNLLLHLFSPGKVATLRVFFNLLFAGIFTYLFCRRLEISRDGALLSACAFAFSGPLVVWVGYPLANVVACLPFLMWAGEGLLARGGLRRSALLGAGMGLSLLGGHPETSFQVLAVFSLYFLARLFLAGPQEGGSRGRVLACYLLAVLLGALVSAVQVLPFLDFMRESSTFARGGRGGHSGGGLFFSPEWLAHLATGLTLFCPNFFGNPLDRNYIWPSAVFQNYNEQAVYFGVVPLALALAALFAGGRRRRPLVIIALLALFCIAVAWHLPGFEAVNHLPVFSMAPNKRLRLPFVFLAAVLAGYGLDALKAQLGERRRGGALIGWALGLSLVLALFVWILGLKFTLGPSVPPESFRFYLFYDVFSFGQWRTYLPLALAAAAGAGYLAARRSPAAARLFPGLVLGLTLCELVALAWGYNPAVPERDILPAAPAVEFLKQRESEPYRILTTDGFFYPNFGAVYGIADVAGYDVPVFQRFSDLYLRQGGRSFGSQIDSRQQWDPQWPLVDFLNVKYVITPRELPGDKFQRVYRTGNLNLYLNLKALPRAFLVYGAETVPERGAQLERLVGGGVDLSRTALLEQAAPAGLPGAGAGSGQVRFARYDNDEVQVTVSSDRPALLIASDLWAPGWSAFLDGKETTLYRANYSYRGVAVPAGSHQVSYRYRPVSYRAGLALTVVGVLLALAGCLIPGRKRAEGGHAG